MMLDNEKDILELYKKWPFSRPYYLGNPILCLQLNFSIKHQWSNWIDASGHDEPPPDFYNDKQKFLMDVMRINDTSYVDSNGRIHNPMLEDESRCINRILGHSKNYSTNENIKVYVVPQDSSLDKIGTYQKYLDGFQRTFEKHNQKIPLYKCNHPNCQTGKTIFFIEDESPAYIEAENETYLYTYAGEVVKGKIHYPFLDKNFLRIIERTNVDFVVWFMPCKLVLLPNGRKYYPPHVAIIQRTAIQRHFQLDYKVPMMTPIEKSAR